ncbi:MAG: hypothetical protein RSA29_14580 [Clostridium sp.]|uniref:hypothetical protein n=1 Tax=Clostridium sp. TaxID=1506 RepID=UPI003216FB47
MAKRGSLDKREKENPKVMRGVMSAFVSSSSTDEVTRNEAKKETINDTSDVNKIDTDSVTVNVQNKEQNSSNNITNSNTVSDTNSNTNIDTINNTDNITNNETISNTNIDSNSNTNNETIFVAENVTNIVAKTVTNKVPKITHVKTIRIGNKSLESIYDSNETTTRCAYHLRKDTIDKIEECSRLSGMKKAEFVDLVLNSTLTDILNKASKK